MANLLQSAPRVAWVALSARHAESKSGFLSRMLLPHLQSHFQIELFQDLQDSSSKLATFSYPELPERHSLRAYDILFYQLEDQPECKEISDLALANPGVVYCHDYFLTRLKPADGSATLFSVCESSRLRFFSGERNLLCYQGERQSMKGRAPEALCTLYLPHPVHTTRASSPAAASDPNSSNRQFTVAFCGSPQIEHRAHKLLTALGEINRTSGIPARLLWLLNEGEVSAAEQLQREFPLADIEFITGRSPERWAEIVSRADAAAHLWFSAHGDPSPYLPISMIAGIPCLVTDFSSTELLPDGVVIKILPGGDSEIEEIRLSLQLCSNKQDNRRAEIAANGRIFAEENHNCQKVATELVESLRSLPRALSGQPNLHSSQPS